MKKKIVLVSSAVLALAAAALLFCALVPCVDGFTVFQSARIKRFIEVNPFHAVGEELVELPVAAAVGTGGYERNTFVGSRVQMESQPDYIELSLASDSQGRLVLADSYADTSESSIDVYRVAKSLLEKTTKTSVLVNLAEYTDLNAVSAFVSASSRFANAVIRVADENTIDYVRGYFPSSTLLCEYSSRSRLSPAELKAKGADGVICSAAMLSAHFTKKVHDAGLVLWVDCGGSVGRVVKATEMAAYVDGLVTTEPELALGLQRVWSYDELLTADAQ